jgi:hypothetical protein
MTKVGGFNHLSVAQQARPQYQPHLFVASQGKPCGPEHSATASRFDEDEILSYDPIGDGNGDCYDTEYREPISFLDDQGGNTMNRA